MNEDQFQIGGIAHFTPPELSESTDRICAVLPARAFMTDPSGFLDDDFSQVRQGMRKIRNCCRSVQQLLHIDSKDFTVLELIEDVLLFFKRRGALQPGLQLPPHRFFVEYCEILENGEQISEMCTQEVIPEKVARPQKVSKSSHSFFAGRE